MLRSWILLFLARPYFSILHGADAPNRPADHTSDARGNSSIAKRPANCRRDY
jgi:hypothetical protein